MRTRGDAVGPADPSLLDGAGPFVMGILNTTPDSFSDGGRHDTVERAVAHGEQMLRDGAHIIDVGGESSRPGADPVSSSEELARVLPVIERLAGQCLISIDTAKPEVADAALSAGAHIVNDITARLEDVAASHNAGWIAMHMLGEPRTMQENPIYGDVVGEIRDALLDAAERGKRAGVPNIWLDPGIGFGKTTKHNLNLLRDVDSLTTIGQRMVVGVSRKRFIGELHAASDGTPQVNADDRLEGSIQAAVWSMCGGAHIVRVHDVRPTALAAALFAA